MKHIALYPGVTKGVNPPPPFKEQGDLMEGALKTVQGEQEGGTRCGGPENCPGQNRGESALDSKENTSHY